MSQYCNMITKTSSLDAAGRRKEQISAKKTEINSLEKRTGYGGILGYSGS